MRLMLVLVAAGAIASAPAVAHEGHAHKLMGTVAVVHDNHIEVKTTDGSTATVSLTKDTKVLRGQSVLKAPDIRIGDRVVVTATETKGHDGKTSLVASQIRLGGATARPATK